MVSLKNCRRIAFIIFICSFGASVYFAVNSVQNFNQTRQSVINSQGDLYYELLEITAVDGNSIRAYLFCDPTVKNWNNHSIPLIVGCHGMSEDLFAFFSFYYNMIQNGYAVLAPEFRGHGSNPNPCTLGIFEPYDIISFLDYVEVNKAFINVNKSGIFGHSMGGLYATSAYIIESQNKGRFQALVSGSGLLNISEEVDFFMDNAAPMGSLSFLNELETKNPVNMDINTTFPRNMMILHGTNDETVDFQCSVDFIRKVDPEKLNNQTGRSDVKFIALEGVNHGLPRHIFYGNALNWFDKNILNKTTSVDEYKNIEDPINRRGQEDGKWERLYLVFALMIAIPSLVYLIKPHPFSIIPDSLENQELSQKTQSNPLESKNILKFMGIYYAILFISGIFARFIIQTYLITELIIFGLGTLGFCILLIKKGTPGKNPERIKKIVKDTVNIKNGLAAGLPIIGVLIGYMIISLNSQFESDYLTFGVRSSWWFYVMWLYFTAQLILNFLISRIILHPINEKGKKERFKVRIQIRLKEILFHLILMSTGMLIYLIWYLGNSGFSIPGTYDGRIELISVLSIGFGLIYLGFTLIIQLFEHLTKSILPGAIFCGLIIPFLASATNLVFFY
jgi:prolyl oligopeptidase family protein